MPCWRECHREQVIHNQTHTHTYTHTHTHTQRAHALYTSPLSTCASPGQQALVSTGTWCTWAHQRGVLRRIRARRYQAKVFFSFPFFFDFQERDDLRRRPSPLGLGWRRIFHGWRGHVCCFAHPPKDNFLALFARHNCVACMDTCMHACMCVCVCVCVCVLSIHTHTRTHVHIHGHTWYSGYMISSPFSPNSYTQPFKHIHTALQTHTHSPSNTYTQPFKHIHTALHARHP